MTRILSELLNVKEVEFTRLASRYGGISGRHDEDIRLTAEIVGSVHMKLKSLGLDPNDTTGKELYQALNALTAKHDEFMLKQFGADSDTEAVVLSQKIVSMLSKNLHNTNIWSVKTSVLKRLIKSHPPKKTMTALGYRSVDSLVKREPVCNILLGAKLLETKSWQDKFQMLYKELGASDFDSNSLRIIYYDGKLSKAVASYVEASRQMTFVIYEMGVIFCFPIPTKSSKGVSIILPTLLMKDAVNLQSMSAFLKLSQTQPDYGVTTHSAYKTGSIKPLAIRGRSIDWGVAYSILSANKNPRFIELLGGHVALSDFDKIDSYHQLARLEPALHFWSSTDFVAVKLDDRLISFNLLDSAINYSAGIKYGQQVALEFRPKLWAEFTERYVSASDVENVLLVD